jgi:hypothetical protein
MDFKGFGREVAKSRSRFRPDITKRTGNTLSDREMLRAENLITLEDRDDVEPD